MQFNPFPILSTQRLLLRPLEMSDDEAVFSLRADKHVNKYLENYAHSSIGETREFIQRIHAGIAANESIFWVICLKDDPRLIGSICLWNLVKEEFKAEVGYVLNPVFQGRGYMQEALTKVIEYGFQEMRLQTIEAITHRNNKASIRLLEKNHFILQERAKGSEDDQEIIFKLGRK